MDPHSFIARAEAQRWLGIAEKLLMGHDLVGSKTFAIRARDSDPRLEAAEQILAIADTLLAAEKRVVGNNGSQQPDYYAILQLVRFVQDTDHIASQYRRLAVMLNPHQNRFPYSDQAFQLVNDAWAVLSNPMRKSMYDSELDFPPQQQMNTIGFNLEQQHHHQHQQQQHHQQQQQHNFFSINHMGSNHEQELPEPQQTFQTRVQQSHQQQQLQQHNFLSQPSPVRQEQLFQHREQEHLFQPQAQPFQVSSPPHQQTRQPPQPPPPQVQPFQVTSPPHHHQTRQPVQPPKREQEQLFHHREQEHLFQPQAQPFQVASPPHQQARQPSQPPPPHVQPFQVTSPPHQQARQQQQPPPPAQVQPFQITSPPHHQTRQPQQPPQPQVQPFQVTSPPHQQTRQQPQPSQPPPRIQSPSPPPPVAAPQPPFSWTQAPPQQQPAPSQPQPQPAPPQSRPQPQPKPQPQAPPPQSLPQIQSQPPPGHSWPQPQPLSQPPPPLSRPQPPPEPQLQQQQHHLHPQPQQQLQQKQEQPPPQPQPQPPSPSPPQPHPQQLQEEESPEHNAAPIELPTEVNIDNGVMAEDIETETEEPAEIVDDSPTFWTSCPFCFYMYEYPKVYVECTLRCDHCQRAFQAVRVPSPPTITEGQDAYFCCWGYFPLGVSMSHLDKNNPQGNKKTWTPFSPMYDASSNVHNLKQNQNQNQNQNHLNGKAAPKENTFVNKSSGPRIHLDDDITDIADDVFMEVSNPTHDSDSGSGSDSDGEQVKDRSQVLAIDAKDAKNGSFKNLGNAMMPVQESGKKDVGGNPRRQSGRVGKELGKLDLNVEFNNNEGHGHGQGEGEGEDATIEGNGFFEGLDEFLSSLPILSVVNEEKVEAAS